MREPERDMPLEAVNGHCLRCQYRLAWIVIRGERSPRPVGHAPAIELASKPNLSGPELSKATAERVFGWKNVHKHDGELIGKKQD